MLTQSINHWPRRSNGAPLVDIYAPVNWANALFNNDAHYYQNAKILRRKLTSLFTIVPSTSYMTGIRIPGAVHRDIQGGRSICASCQLKTETRLHNDKDTAKIKQGKKTIYALLCSHGAPRVSRCRTWRLECDMHACLDNFANSAVGAKLLFPLPTCLFGFVLY